MIYVIFIIKINLLARYLKTQFDSRSDAMSTIECINEHTMLAPVPMPCDTRDFEIMKTMPKNYNGMY